MADISTLAGELCHVLRLDRTSRSLKRGWLVALVWLGVTAAADAQLRVVTYNTTGAPYNNTQMALVLKSIGEELRNGVAKPIDILLLQEQDNTSPGLNSPSADT